MKSVMKNSWLLILVGLCPVTAGCGPSQAQPSPVFQPPEVLVSLPIAREVTDYVDFPGRIEAVNSIEVRARVTGYLDKVHFQEGADVKQGDLLFEIDPRPLQAAADQAEGQLAQAKAQVLQEVQQPPRAAGITAVLLDLLRPAESEASLSLRVPRTVARGDQVTRMLIEMKA